MNSAALTRSVRWRDLTRSRARDLLIENTLPLPWLGASWALAYQELYLAALPCSAFFFLTTLRQVHGGSLATHRGEKAFAGAPGAGDVAGNRPQFEFGEGAGNEDSGVPAQ